MRLSSHAAPRWIAAIGSVVATFIPVIVHADDAVTGTGYFTVQSGDGAWNRIQDRNFDLVITDNPPLMIEDIINPCEQMCDVAVWSSNEIDLTTHIVRGATQLIKYDSIRHDFGEVYGGLY